MEGTMTANDRQSASGSEGARDRRNAPGGACSTGLAGPGHVSPDGRGPGSEAVGPSPRLNPTAASSLPEPGGCRILEPAEPSPTARLPGGNSLGNLFGGLLVRFFGRRDGAGEEVEPGRSGSSLPRLRGVPRTGLRWNGRALDATHFRLARLGGAAFIVLAALTLGAPVEAQVTTFVTNYGQVDLSDQAASTNTTTSRAQQFAAGSHAAGYLLDGIDMTVTTQAGGTATYSAYLCTVDTDGFPSATQANLSRATSCVSLTKPTTGNKYTPPANTYLASGRTYSIIAAKTGGTGNVIVNVTWKDAEDATPAAGWSIGNSYDFWSSRGREWRKTSTTTHVTLGVVDRAVRIAVKGTTRSASTDATLSALALSEGTLGPAFSSAHTSYTASVGDAVSRITVTPTTNDAGATDFAGNSIAKPTVEYLDASDTALTDADTASTETFEVDLSSGSNVIKVKVTAADGTTTKTYTVTVTRAAAPTDAILSALSLSSGTLSPTFSSAHTSYTASVGYPVSRITVTPTTGHASATVTYLDASDDALTDADTASTDSFEVDLSSGANVIKVKVTAAEGAALKTYTVTVTRAAASTDATLGALALSPGTLSPAFASADTSYTASVGYPVSRVTLSATASDAGATIAYLDGSDDALTDADTSSTGSFEVDLSVGANVIKVKVTAGDDTTVKTYTVTVTRAAASTDATLSALSLSPGTLSPAFSSADTSYTASVVYPVSRVTVSATASDAGATIAYLDGSDDALTDADTSSTDTFEVDLSEGANVIKVKVTAENATTVKTYTVTVTRAAASTDAALGVLALSPGTLSPAFASAVTSYTASVVYAVSRVTVSATASDSGATIAYLDGSDDALTDADTASTDSFEVDLSEGANVIKVKVTAENATTVKTYTVTVTRTPASTDAALSALSLSSGTLSPVFASADTSYTASVVYAVSRVTVSPTTNYSNAGIAYLDGSDDALTDADTASTDSFEVDLSEGANVIKVKVTAEDATTVKTYTVTVTRTPASTDAALSALSLSSGTLSPVFASADTSYTASVVYAVTRITVSPTTNYSNAGIAYLDGSDDALTDADTSSTDSFEVDLSEGANVIKVKVTAEDATTTETYTVTVTRAAPSTDANLGALSLSPGTLSPAFASTHTSYTASVVYVVTRVTVAPTKNQATATIAYLDGSDDALTDADTASTGSFEVDLSVGANVIKVKVTAENATTVKTYTVTVTRAAPSTDEDDFTATTATQGTVSVGGSATGEIEVRGDVDWFAVTLETGQRYRINLEGSPTGAGTLVDPELRGVHDAAGTPIAGTRNDDGGTGYNSRLTFTAESSATYYVAAGAYQDRIGTYKLSVTEGVSDDFAATTATQGTVSVGGSATGEIELRGDVDWFAVTLEAGKSYRIDLKGSPTGDGTLRDPYLYGVHDAAGTRLARTTNVGGGTGENSQVRFTAGASATYYVAAGANTGRSARGSPEGTYTLMVTELSDDFTATTATQGRVSVGGSATGEIELSDDVDWFAVTLEAGQSYRIDLEGAWTSAGTVVDPYLRGVHDAAGTLIAGTTNNNGGTRRNSRLTFAAESSATYYVAAGAAPPSQTGTYTLSVTSVTPPPSSIWTATLTVQALRSSRLGCDDFDRNRAKGCRQTAVLTNRSVTYGTNTYNMIYIRVTSAGTFQLRFSGTVAEKFHSDLVFKAGDSEFVLSDKSRSSSYSWTGSGLSWSEDDEVSLAFVKKGAPTAADGAVTTAEDTAYTFAATDFGFVGADATDTLSSVKITALPTLGSLTLDDTAVDADDSITKADIDASRLVFTPVANANGDGYTDFSFKLNDGATESTAAYTMTIDVTAVNDVPAGLPTISGTARVGETLIASATEISDADGLTGATFAWQWVRIDGKDETDITGATSITYVPVTADLDDELKVEVSFTDDDDTDEGPFSSAATAAVAAKTSRQVTRTNATLSALSLSPGTLIPVFSAAVTSYTASVGYAVSRVTVSPTKNQASATIAYLDGSDGSLTDADTSSTGSFEVDLSVGANVIKVQVTAGDGITVNTYTVTVTRAAASTDATLSALSLSPGTLSPVFASAHTTYAASVGTTVARITVSPTTNDANATVEFLAGNAGDAVLTDANTSSADTFEVDLWEGNNLIKVKVTAEDGTATVTYSVTVTRASPLLNNMLVSNLGRSISKLDARISTSVTSNARAVKFSTGSYAATLLSVEFSISNYSVASTATVKLFTGTESSNGTLTLGTEVASFTGPASLTAYSWAKTYTFTAPANTDLAAMTDYYILVRQSSGDGFILWTQYTGGAVDSGSKAGWAIPNNVWSRTTGSTGTLSRSTWVPVFRLRGAETYIAPGAPQDFTATAGHAEVTLGWTAPESDGGSAITHYQYRHATGSMVPTSTSWTDVADSSDPGGSTGDETSVTVTSLTNETQYAFEVRAVNAVGEGTKAGPMKATPSADADATLSALSLSPGTLSPEFSSSQTAYTASVEGAVSRVTVSATAADSDATIAYLDGSDTVLTDAHTSSTDTFEVALSVGGNVIKVKVTAKNGTTTRTYTVAVTRGPASTDATLSALAVSPGTLSPEFSSEVTSYTASVGYLVSRVTVSATAADSDATIAYLDESDTVLTDADTSSTDTFEVALSVGGNAIKVKVTAADSATMKTYTVTVTRGPASSDATLSALAVSPGTLSPGFSPEVTSYTASVRNTVSRITVTPTTNHASAVVAYLDASDAPLTDAETSSTDTFEVDLSEGANIIKVKVTAEDGTATKTYTVTVTRGAAASADATLSALALSEGTLSPMFSSAHTSYTASVVNAVSRITVTPTTSHASATVAYLDASDTALTDANTSSADTFEVDLSAGANIIKVKVTAEDSATTKTYTVTVTRGAAASTDATLSALALSEGTLSPMFSSAHTSYTASVVNAVSRITVTPTTSHASATVAYLDASDTALTDANTSSADTFEVDLSVGANVIKVKVTAADTTTMKTYTVTVTRATGNYTNGDLRLVDGQVAHEGRLEMFHGDEWGTICDDYWTEEDAAVACRQLGYAGAERTFLRSAFGGAASGVPVWLDDVLCTRTEARLIDCPRAGNQAVGAHNCSRGHTEDAGVRCVAEPAPGTDGFPVFRMPDGVEYERGASATVTPGTTTVRYTVRLSRAPANLPPLSRHVRMAVEVESPGRGATVEPATGYWAQPDLKPGGWTQAEEVAVTLPASLRAGAEVSILHTLGRNGDADNDFPGEFRVTLTVAAQALVGEEAPAITGAPALSEAGTDGVWAPGETAEVTLTFSEAVTADTTGGTPSVGLSLGGTKARSATYRRGSGTTALVFGYTLTAADGSHSSLLVPIDGLALNGGAIRSQASGADAALGHLGTAKVALPPDDNQGQVGTRDEGDPFTARFEGLPERHDGAGAFSFELRFSEAPQDLSDSTVANGLLEVTGAAVTGARRLAAGSNLAWEVTVTPSQSGNIAIRLPARACTETHAVCAGGRALANAVSATVEGVPLTASFSGVPAEHDGETAFDIRFHLSEEPAGLSYRTVRDGLFDVTGGRIEKASRLEAGKNNGWSLRIDPSGVGDVTVRVKATSACGSAPGVCTADGRKLAGGLQVVIAGPATLSVADTEVEEASGATLDFVVTLSKARFTATTVDYATSDDTATAGSDYTSSSGMLTFAPLETTKTVSVSVLDDAHDEGSETMTLTLSNASGARLGDSTATGTINNTGAMPKAWMVRFGRTVGSQVVDALTQRLEGAGASHVTVAGINVIGGPGPEPQAEDDDPFGLPEWAKNAEREADARTITADDLLLRSAFHLSSGGDATQGGGPAFTAWGRVATGGFEAEADGVTMDGDVTTGLVGFDAEWERALAGIMFSQSSGDGTYRQDTPHGKVGTVESSLTGVYPYARVDLNAKVSAWALAGVGSGELTLHQEVGKPMPTDISMRMGAVGVKGQVLDGTGASGLAMNVKSDAMWVGMKSGRTNEMVATEGDVTRVRLIVEGERSFETASGATLTPSAEIGLRHDGGDAETGTGVEVGAGLRYIAGPLTIEGQVRALIAHGASGYEEWGMSGAIRVTPSPSGRGLTLAIAPAWGRTESAAGRLWSAQDARGLGADNEFEADSRLEMEAGYGLGLPGSRGVLTPYAGMTLGDAGARAVRTGTRWQLGPDAVFGLETTRQTRDAAEAGARTVRSDARWQLGPDSVVGLEATRHTSDAAEADNQLMLRVALRF